MENIIEWLNAPFPYQNLADWVFIIVSIIAVFAIAVIIYHWNDIHG